MLLLLAGIGNAADPGWQGKWLLKRVVEMVDGRPTVRGLCEDQVNAAMSQVAAAVGRPLDWSFVDEFVAETLDRQDRPDDRGPLEQALRELRGTDEGRASWRLGPPPSASVRPLDSPSLRR